MSEDSKNNNLLSYIATTVEQMRDKMETLATKDELKVQIAAVRGDIEQVHLRLDSIEKTLTGRLA